MSGLSGYEHLAESLAKGAGSLLNKHLGRIRKISYKGKMNLVTDVDKKCERFIIGAIKKAFPTHKVISEEAGNIAGKSHLCWVIDPLDGTTNYVHGFPFFCVSIALLENKDTILGMVYDPARDELFSAVKGKGAYLNHRKINVSNIKGLNEALLATGFPYRFGMPARRKRNIDNFKRFMFRAQAVRRAGSAALDLCYVAAGRVDGFWELDLHPWDTAAGAIIAEEAKGKVTTFKGEAFNPFKKDIVASNSKLHEEMLEVIR